MVDFLRALEQFDASGFTSRHGGSKESASSRSHEYLLPCPWCVSSRLRWNHPTKKGWQCWGCGRHGSTMELIQAAEKCTYEQAVDFVMRGYVGGDANLTLRAITAPKPRTAELPGISWPAGVDVLTECEMHRACWRYLQGRGVDAAIAKAWRLGFGRYGRVANYVVFPVFMDGVLVYWQGRACWDPPKTLDAEQRKAWVRETHYLKSVNPIASADFATASEVLLNYDRARVEPHVVIVEGPFDTIKVGVHAVGLLGKEPSDAKIARLLRMKAQRYTIYLDRGEREAQCARVLARELSNYAPTYIAVPPIGFDPGALSPIENSAVIATAARFTGGLQHIRA